MGSKLEDLSSRLKRLERIVSGTSNHHGAEPQHSLPLHQKNEQQQSDQRTIIHRLNRIHKALDSASLQYKPIKDFVDSSKSHRF